MYRNRSLGDFKSGRVLLYCQLAFRISQWNMELVVGDEKSEDFIEECTEINCMRRFGWSPVFCRNVNTWIMFYSEFY